jgi:hypothetical protein
MVERSATKMRLPSIEDLDAMDDEEFEPILEGPEKFPWSWSQLVRIAEQTDRDPVDVGLDWVKAREWYLERGGK